MAGGLADVLNIAGADALLAGADPLPGRRLVPGKPRLHGRHARVDQQQRRVILGNQREAGQTQVAFCLKEAEEHLSQLIYAIGFHVLFLQTMFNLAMRSGAAIKKASAPGTQGRRQIRGTTLICPPEKRTSLGHPLTGMRRPGPPGQLGNGRRIWSPRGLHPPPLAVGPLDPARFVSAM